MSDAIHFSIQEHDNGRIKLLLDQLPEKIRRRLRVTIAQLTNELLRKVEAAEPVRTGTLRQQTVAFIDEGVNKGGHWIRGRVRVLRDEGGTNYGRVAGALEYGAPGKRRGGKPVKVTGYRRQSVKVRSYTRRRPNIKAQRFLRGPAAAQRPRARAALMAIIGPALQEEI